MGWLAGWAKRIKITIDHNDVDASLSHFPVLLYLSSSSGITGVDVTPVFDEVGANSKKIAVTKSDGTTQLYVEIEKWDSVGEKAWLWISRSGWSISNTVDTDIYIYYDNSKADNTTYVDNTNSTPAENVWDAHFKAVYHLAQTDGDTPAQLDSTSNNRDLTAHNTEAVDFGVTDGKHHCFAPDGTDEYLDVAYTLDGESEGMLECFFKTSIDAKAWLVSMPDSGTGNGFDLQSRPDLSPERMRSYVKGVAAGATIDINCDPDDGGWHHAATKYKDNVGAEIYFDGASQSDVTDRGLIDADHNQLAIAQFGGDGYHFFNGFIDEVRISDLARSDAWVKATYESGRDHFVTYGSEETPPVKGKPASIIPLMRVMDMISTVKPWSKRFPKLKPRLVA